MLETNAYHMKKWECLHSGIICPLTREVTQLQRCIRLPQKNLECFHNLVFKKCMINKLFLRSQ